MIHAAKALAAAQAIETALVALKAAVVVNATDTQINNALIIASGATTTAVADALAANGTVLVNPLLGGLGGANAIALEALASTGAQNLTNMVDVTEKANFDTGFDNALTNTYSAGNVDELIAANRVFIANLTVVAADKAATAAATSIASTIATTDAEGA